MITVILMIKVMIIKKIKLMTETIALLLTCVVIKTIKAEIIKILVIIIMIIIVVIIDGNL